MYVENLKMLLQKAPNINLKENCRCWAKVFLLGILYMFLYIRILGISVKSCS